VLSFFQSLIPTSTEPTDIDTECAQDPGKLLRRKKVPSLFFLPSEKKCLLTLAALASLPDANRKRVLEHPLSLTPIITALSDPETRIIAAVVLLNICADYGWLSLPHKPGRPWLTG
jgi:hypothetical protein